MTLMSGCEIRTPIPTLLRHLGETHERACQDVIDRTGQWFLPAQTLSGVLLFFCFFHNTLWITPADKYCGQRWQSNISAGRMCVCRSWVYFTWPFSLTELVSHGVVHCVLVWMFTHTHFNKWYFNIYCIYIF